jgi:uncharacterized protein YdhG (YjbR/CyaY superfamily)
MFMWFGLQRNHVGLHLHPPTISNHGKELAGYVTTKAAAHLPSDEKAPATLVKELVRASAKV